LHSIKKNFRRNFWKSFFFYTNQKSKPNQSPQTILSTVKSWAGVIWGIQGNVKHFLNYLCPQTLATILNKSIKDKNIIDLYWKLIKAGYLSIGKQGVSNHIIHSLFLNICLNEFDIFMEQIKHEYFLQSSNAKGCCHNLTEQSVGRVLNNKFTYINGDINIQKRIIAYVPLSIVKIYYARCGENWLIGVKGSKEITKTLKNRIIEYFWNNFNLASPAIKLNLTHAQKNKLWFLGTEIKWPFLKDETLSFQPLDKHRIKVYSPIKAIITKLKNEGFAKKKYK